MESKRKRNRRITEDTTIRLRTSIEKMNGVMIKHAREIAHEMEASALLVYVDLIKSRKNLEPLIKGSRCILATRVQDVIDDLKVGEGLKDRIVYVPYMNLSRLSQVKVAAILALSSRLINVGDRLVCLCGSLKTGILDFLMVIEIGGMFQVLLSKDSALPNQMGFSHVFDRLLTLSIELATEGKEGKPLGTIFVLGDHEKVVELSSQMVFNPFANVPEGERNILDPRLKETIREFASIDGAFIIRDDGVILAAGRHLKASAEDADLPQGLGAKHRAAAGITSLTNALAIVISESTGDVRIFSNGKIFMEIEKAAGEQVTS